MVATNAYDDGRHGWLADARMERPDDEWSFEMFYFNLTLHEKCIYPFLPTH